MNFIVIDLEYNQNFNFKTGSKAPSNPFLPLEIIQIGAVKVDGQHNIVDKFGTMVRPSIYRGLNPFVAKVTGLSAAALRRSPPFSAAYRGLVNFIGTSRSPLCFWGSDDMRELYRNILFFGQNPRLLSKKYINVQSLASAHLDLPTKQQLALGTVVKFLGLDCDIPFHNAPNDALYTAQIFTRIYDEEKINMLTFDLRRLIQHNNELEMEKKI